MQPDVDKVYRLFFGAMVQGGVEPLVKLAYKLLGHPIVVGDEVGSLVMLWPDVDMDVPAWHEMYANRTIPQQGFLDVNDEYRQDPVEADAVTVVRGRFLYEGTQVMVRFEEDGDAVGFLSVNYGDDGPSAGDLEVAKVFAAALKPELVRLRQKGREREDYLISLLRASERKGRDYELAITELTRKYPGKYRVLCIENLPGSAASSIEAIKRRVNRSAVSAIAVDWDRVLVVLEYRLDSADGFDEGLSAITGGYAVRVGRSTSFGETAFIPDHLAQAAATLDVGKRLDPEGRVYDYRDFAPRQVMSVCARSADPSVFVHPAVDGLLSYDSSHGTQLAPTLDAFLFHQANRTKTAEALNIHPNTLAYRLRRIGELFGIDYEDMGLMSELRMSFLAVEYLHPTGRDSPGGR